MKAKCVIFSSILASFLFMNCGLSEPTKYIHSEARFEIIVPAGFKLEEKMDNLYVFSRGKLMLIEVGAFDVGMNANELHSLSQREFSRLLEDLGLRGLKIFCQTALYTGQHISEREETVWNGLPAFRIKARGFSAAANRSVIIDMAIGVHKDRGIMYLFASQVAKSKYDKIQADIQASINSFQVL